MTIQAASSTYPEESQQIEFEVPREEIPVSVQEPDNTRVEIDTMKPGARLHYAREQKNLSIQHVADRLYLDNSVIKALEADNYESLPSSIFVRGYLRNYAKVLEIPPDAILEAYDLLTGKKTTLPVLSTGVKQKTQASSNDSWVKAITFTVIITSIIFMALWQIAPNSSSPPSEEPKPITLDLGKTQPIPPAVSKPDAPTSEGTQPNPLSVGTGGEPPISTGTPGTAGVPSANTGTSGTQPAIPSGMHTGTEIDSSIGTPVDTTTPVVENDPGVIKVSSNKNTWMRIVDKTNKTLYEGVSKEDGEVISVTGTPPFKVKVGRVDGVNVDYMGQKTDFVTLPNRTGKGKKEAILGTAPN